MYGHKRVPLAAVLAVACGTARAEMGSVWVEGVAKSAITINWAEPTLGHRFATKSPGYTITAEAVSSYPYSEPLTEAHKLSYRLSGEESRPHTIVGLHANTNYRITVEAYAEKKTIFGQWIDAKDRLQPARERDAPRDHRRARFRSRSCSTDSRRLQAEG
jgi:hypothetical protein